MFKHVQARPHNTTVKSSYRRLLSDYVIETRVFDSYITRTY